MNEKIRIHINNEKFGTHFIEKELLVNDNEENDEEIGLEGHDYKRDLAEIQALSKEEMAALRTQFMTQLKEMNSYLKSLYLSDKRSFNRKNIDLREEGLDGYSAIDLMKYIINSSEYDWKAHPSTFNAIKVRLAKIFTVIEK